MGATTPRCTLSSHVFVPPSPCVQIVYDLEEDSDDADAGSDPQAGSPSNLSPHDGSDNDDIMTPNESPSHYAADTGFSEGGAGDRGGQALL